MILPLPHPQNDELQIQFIVAVRVVFFQHRLSAAKLKHDSDHVGLEGVKYVEMAQLALYLGGGKLE